MRKFMAIVLVVVLVFAMATVAFADGVVSPEKQNTNPTPTPNGNASHQTGESAPSMIWIVLAAVVLLGVAFFCGKKFIAVK